jgi:hypothetical protein
VNFDRLASFGGHHAGAFSGKTRRYTLPEARRGSMLAAILCFKHAMPAPVPADMEPVSFDARYVAAISKPSGVTSGHWII